MTIFSRCDEQTLSVTVLLTGDTFCSRVRLHRTLRAVCIACLCRSRKYRSMFHSVLSSEIPDDPGNRRRPDEAEGTRGALNDKLQSYRNENEDPRRRLARYETSGAQSDSPLPGDRRGNSAELQRRLDEYKSQERKLSKDNESLKQVSRLMMGFSERHVSHWTVIFN